MNLYSARRWLYIAETCSSTSPIDLIYIFFYSQEIGVGVGSAHSGDVRPQYFQLARS